MHKELIKYATKSQLLLNAIFRKNKTKTEGIFFGPQNTSQSVQYEQDNLFKYREMKFLLQIRFTIFQCCRKIFISFSE